MRQNPYLKQEQEFRPLLMRGSFGNNFLTTSEQTRQELSLASETPKKTYTLKGIKFDMKPAPSLNTNGTMLSTMNVEMCTTECTQELFEVVMGFNYARLKDKTDSAQRPIENVTWFDCIVFCNKLSDVFGYAPYYDVANIRTLGDGYSPRTIISAKVNIIGGNGFRLPTDEEWLAFAKAGTNNRWSGTNNENDLWYYAWYRDNSNHQTYPVATKKPNEWGMYDMSGNVMEWCWDEGDFTWSGRVSRGGSFSHIASYLHLVKRDDHSPSSHSDFLGFRFVRTIE